MSDDDTASSASDGDQDDDDGSYEIGWMELAGCEQSVRRVLDSAWPIGFGVVLYELRPSHNDYRSDRLSHRLTVLLLIGIALVAGGKQFVDNPIHCWPYANVNSDYVHR